MKTIERRKSRARTQEGREKRARKNKNNPAGGEARRQKRKEGKGEKGIEKIGNSPNEKPRRK
jgi:hypothetical protein